jgi:hypothetical protein
MNLINSPISNSLKSITMIAAAVFALTVDGSFAFAQRGGGGGHMGGTGGHIGGGGGGHMGGTGGHMPGVGGRVGGAGGHTTGGRGQPTGGGRPTSGGGHRQGTPTSGPSGVSGQPDSNHNPAKSDGRGSNGRRSETDHHHVDGRDGDHRDRGHGDHGDHDRDRDHHFRPLFYSYDPLFWGWGYPYGPYYPYPDDEYSYPDYIYPDQSHGYSDQTHSDQSEAASGGISFTVTPAEAFVYVDDTYIGMASAFSSGSRPLSLTTGSHRIELRATGYRPIAFQVNIVAGQVIPYHVDLTPTVDR